MVLNSHIANQSSSIALRSTAYPLMSLREVTQDRRVITRCITCSERVHAVHSMLRLCCWRHDRQCVRKWKRMRTQIVHQDRDLRRKRKTKENKGSVEYVVKRPS